MDMHQVVGHRDILFVTLDCLRYDVAQRAWKAGLTPILASVLPSEGWEERDTPGTFTLSAHLAFFHGFLPTPRGAGPHPRLLALAFEGSLTISRHTYVFEDVPDLISGFRQLGYRTLCIGGVGFFNSRNPLGRVLPGFFQESYWGTDVGVTVHNSTARQVEVACSWLAQLPTDQRALLFINISATHPPHAHYLPGCAKDCPDSQLAALVYVDTCLPPLFALLRQRGSAFTLFLADHGEAHGEDGCWGHRLAHPTVTTVPYAHFLL